MTTNQTPRGGTAAQSVSVGAWNYPPHTAVCYWNAFACAAENYRDADGSLDRNRATFPLLASWAQGYQSDGLVSCDCEANWYGTYSHATARWTRPGVQS